MHTYTKLKFLLTRPMRDVTMIVRRRTSKHRFLLTRPMRDVTRAP